MSDNVQHTINLQSPPGPSARQLAPPHALVSLSPPAQRQPMDTAHNDNNSQKIEAHIVSPQLIRYFPRLLSDCNISYLLPVLIAVLESYNRIPIYWREKSTSKQVRQSGGSGVGNMTEEQAGTLCNLQ